MSDRFYRAQSQEMELTIIENDDMAIRSGGSDETHVLHTEGSEAISCTCPDYENRNPDGGCKHMIAWENWFIDEVKFSDGEVAWTRD